MPLPSWEERCEELEEIKRADRRRIAELDRHIKAAEGEVKMLWGQCDEQRQRIRDLEKDRSEVKAWGQTWRSRALENDPNVVALIEAVGIHLKLRTHDTWVNLRSSYEAVVLPAPQPTRMELLEEEHRAWGHYIQGTNPPGGQMMNRFNNALSAHRAVEEAGEE